jgi:hypothetical protein
MSRILTTRGLLGYAPLPLFKNIRNWWLQRAERHYLICADVEARKAKEAMANQAYYQRRAALARSARI